MRCDLGSLLVFSLSQWLVSAARPTNFAALTSDLVGELEARSRRACPEEEPLRQVLLGLGLEDKELSDMPDVFGVEWDNCDVLEINLEFHPKLKGPLSPAFRELSKLETLNLGGTEVTGDLAVLDHSSELVQLDLRETKIAGDLKALEKAVGLWQLDLSKTQVSGDLEALKNAEDLQDLDLSDTKVEGDIQALQKATKLENLDLSDTKVEGDIKALQKATKLKNLRLENTNTYGSEASLRDAKHLDNVKTTGTKITAGTKCPREEELLRQVLLGLGLQEEKLSDLQNVKGVEWYNCDVRKMDLRGQPELQGSLSPALLEFPQLEHLNLRGTEVSGDLAMLAECKKLTKLDLSKTKVAGDLKAIANTVKMSYLYLSDTKVEGNIKALQNATELRTLDLENTNISGDMASLRDAKYLHTVDINGTRITGTKCSRDEELLQQVLRGLGLKDKELSNLHEDYNVLVEWHGCDVTSMDLLGKELKGSLSPALCEFRKLHALGLSGTELSGDLAMLAKCNELIDLHLSKTKVTGDIKSLSNMEKLKVLNLRDTQVFGALEAFKNALDLRYLGLSQTSVTGDLKALEHPVSLKHMDIAQTNVTGRLNDFLRRAQHLVHLDLSHTKANGSLSSLEEAVTGTGKKLIMLEWLDLSHTEVTGDVKELQGALFHGVELKYLDISGIAIEGDISVTPLRSESLETFKAAGCGLQGTLSRWFFKFSAVATLDLASNEITRVEYIPRKCRTLILAANATIDFAPGILRKAVENYVFVDLRNVTLGNKMEAWHLLNSSVVQLSGGKTNYKESGFACRDIVGTSLQVSPEKFSPERLCTCMPGWSGNGTDCTMCRNDTFKETYSDVDDTCLPCPPGSKAPPGSTQLKVCSCDIGKIYEKNGVSKCGCRAHEAFLNDKDGCVSCSKLQLDCSTQGSKVQSAKPLPGFFRFDNMSRAYRCLEPKERCTPDRNGSLQSPDPVCRSNYTGTMCMECAAKFYAHGRLCEKCPHAQIPDALLLPLVGGFAVACGLAAFGLWRWIRREAQGIPSRRSALMKQLMAQAPLLLQMCQLWAVLATLASHTAADPEDSQSDQKNNDNKSTFWEIPYVQFLQFSMTNLKGALTLQCRFDGRAVRFVSAMAAPLLPLLVLLCCMAVELMKPGLGITAALQALTLLFVGGASSTSALLSCRRKDGFRDPLPQGSEFRILMPYIPCGNSTSSSASTLTLKTQVDSVGYSAALVYIAVIPLCLLYLLLRLRTVLQASVTTTWAATAVRDGLKVRVSDLVPVSTDSIEKKPLDREDVRRLIAAAVACMAVLYRGRVEVQVTDRAAIVRPLEDTSTRASRDLLEGDLMDIFEGENARAEKLKCRVIAKMLTERAVLQGVLSDDRLLSGAKSLLMKYALGRHIWLEIVQKLVAVALVAIVSKIEGMMMPVAVTLVMAATSVAVRPYAQPQVNTLHSFSFFCLAVSAVSFAWGEPWPGRIALAAPFALSALQALRPDSAEALAIRLWEDLERQIDALEREEVVEVTVETYRFL